jgi:hypothetical protein
MEANDYLVTGYDTYQFVIYDMTSNTRIKISPNNPRLSLFEDQQYKFLVKSIGHPFVIKDSNDNIVGTVDGGVAPVPVTGVEDGVYEFTLDSSIYVYSYHNIDHSDMRTTIYNSSNHPSFQIDVLYRTTTSIVWVITVTSEDYQQSIENYNVSGKIKVAGTSTDDSVSQSADRTVSVGFSSTLTFDNLSPDIDYELYDLQFVSDSVSGDIPDILQQRTSSEPTSHQPTFVSASTPIRTNNSISWKLKQTNSNFNEPITLRGIIGFQVYRFHTRFSQQYDYDANNDIMTLTFSGLFDPSYPWSLHYLTWRRTDSSDDVPTPVEDLTFLYQEISLGSLTIPDLTIILVSATTSTVKCKIERTIQPSSVCTEITEAITLDVRIKLKSADRSDDDAMPINVTVTNPVTVPASDQTGEVTQVYSAEFEFTDNLSTGQTYEVYRKSWKAESDSEPTESYSSFHYVDVEL